MAKRHLDCEGSVVGARIGVGVVLAPTPATTLDSGSRRRMSLDLVNVNGSAVGATAMTRNRLLARRKAAKHGGFLDFQATFPSLCETKSCCPTNCGTNNSSGGGGGINKFSGLTSLSQPCLPSANVGPTKILPYLFLGSQQDALSEETIKNNGITYILNVSTTCPQPAYIADEHFLRIPVNDNHCDKLQPFFHEAFSFLDKVNQAGGRAMVHCLAGISRSATIAIAYVMTHLGLSHEEAYKYVKEKRPTISPNLNFMGQLIAYEKQLQQERNRDQLTGASPEESSKKKQCLEEVGLPTPPTPQTPTTALVRPRSFKFAFKSATSNALSPAAQSPTTALSKLSFGGGCSPQPHTLQPSPLSETAPEEASTPASEAGDTIGSFPMTSLDKVIPIPCITQGSSATKRSLSMSTFELRSVGLNESFNNSHKNRPAGAGAGDVSGVVPHDSAASSFLLRSPELRAKRRPGNAQRPNSIAFASCFTLDTLHQQDNTSTTAMTQTVPTTTTATSCHSQAPPPPLPPPPSIIPSAASLLIPEDRTLEQQSRKSRSLEDILGPDICGHGLRKSSRDNGLYAADQCRLGDAGGVSSNATSHHQSNSSISSSGSIHGSLELIQVS